MTTSAPNTLLTYQLSVPPKSPGDLSVDSDSLAIAIGNGLSRTVTVDDDAGIALAIPFGTGPGDLVEDPATINTVTTGGEAPSQGGGWDVERYQNAAGTHEVFLWTPRRARATFTGKWSLTLTLADFQPNPAARRVEIAIKESASADPGRGTGLACLRLTLEAGHEPVFSALTAPDIFEP